MKDATAEWTVRERRLAQRCEEDGKTLECLALLSPQFVAGFFDHLTTLLDVIDVRLAHLEKRLALAGIETVEEITDEEVPLYLTMPVLGLLDHEHNPYDDLHRLAAMAKDGTAGEADLPADPGIAGDGGFPKGTGLGLGNHR